MEAGSTVILKGTCLGREKREMMVLRTDGILVYCTWEDDYGPAWQWFSERTLEVKHGGNGPGVGDNRTAG